MGARKEYTRKESQVMHNLLKTKIVLRWIISIIVDHRKQIQSMTCISFIYSERCILVRVEMDLDCILVTLQWAWSRNTRSMGQQSITGNHAHTHSHSVLFIKVKHAFKKRKTKQNKKQGIQIKPTRTTCETPHR